VRFNILRAVYLKGDTVLLGEWLLLFEGMWCFHLQRSRSTRRVLDPWKQRCYNPLNVRNYSPEEKEYQKLCVSKQSLCFALHQAFSDVRGNWSVCRQCNWPNV